MGVGFRVVAPAQNCLLNFLVVLVDDIGFRVLAPAQKCLLNFLVVLVVGRTLGCAPWGWGQLEGRGVDPNPC